MTNKKGATVTSLAVPDKAVLERFLQAADNAEIDVDPEQVTLDIIARILNATDAAGVLDRGKPTKAADYLDRPFMLTDVKFLKSDFESKAGEFFAVLSGADLDGAPLTITCGAKNVIAAAWKLADLDALPVEVQLKRSERPTSAGYHVMWLESGPGSF